LADRLIGHRDPCLSPMEASPPRPSGGNDASGRPRLPTRRPIDRRCRDEARAPQATAAVRNHRTVWVNRSCRIAGWPGARTSGLRLRRRNRVSARVRR